MSEGFGEGSEPGGVGALGGGLGELALMRASVVVSAGAGVTVAAGSGAEGVAWAVASCSRRCSMSRVTTAEHRAWRGRSGGPASPARLFSSSSTPRRCAALAFPPPRVARAPSAGAAGRRRARAGVEGGLSGLNLHVFHAGDLDALCGGHGHLATGVNLRNSSSSASSSSESPNSSAKSPSWR